MAFVQRFFVTGLIGLGLLGTLAPRLAAGAPIPPTTPEEIYTPLELNLDIHNLTNSKGDGAVPEAVFNDLIQGVNRYWSACGIQFFIRTSGNVNAEALKVPYEPQSQEDLSRIAAALNPNGFFGGIPFTVAGPWHFKSGTIFLHGLGWVFINDDGQLNRVGAMIGANLLRVEHAPALVGHELGHALSLGHSPDPANLLAGGTKLVREQCVQARGFSQTTLARFIRTTERLQKSVLGQNQ